MANAQIYEGKEDRPDSIMMENSEENEPIDTSLFIPLWFAKALLFVRIHLLDTLLKSN